MGVGWWEVQILSIKISDGCQLKMASNGRISVEVCDFVKKESVQRSFEQTRQPEALGHIRQGCTETAKYQRGGKCE